VLVHCVVNITSAVLPCSQFLVRVNALAVHVSSACEIDPLDRLSLNCLNFWPCYILAIDWKHCAKKLWPVDEQEFFVVRTTIKIKNATLANQGVYQCRGSNTPKRSNPGLQHWKITESHVLDVNCGSRKSVCEQGYLESRFPFRKQKRLIWNA